MKQTDGAGYGSVKPFSIQLFLYAADTAVSLKKISFHPMRRIVLILCLLVAACFAQSETAPIAEVDSAAYYEQTYECNYQKFRTDESVSDVLFWTSVGLSVVASYAL